MSTIICEDIVVEYTVFLGLISVSLFQGIYKSARNSSKRSCDEGEEDYELMWNCCRKIRDRNLAFCLQYSFCGNTEIRFESVNKESLRISTKLLMDIETECLIHVTGENNDGGLKEPKPQMKTMNEELGK